MVVFLRYRFRGLIFGEAYFRNFTVFHVGTKHVSLHNTERFQ